MAIQSWRQSLSQHEIDSAEMEDMVSNHNMINVHVFNIFVTLNS